MAETPVIYWYRQDLRVDDLPGLAAAASAGRPVLPCFILDDTLPERERPGGASRWWRIGCARCMCLAFLSGTHQYLV